MSLIDDLQWRYATKKMNGETISREKLDYILEAARLAPSSSGIQPYRIFVIANRELLEKIKPVAMNQSQITDCSHLLVFAAWDGYSLERITEVFNYTLEQRGLPQDTMDDYKNNLWSLYEPLGKEWHAQHAAKQSYIALGMALAAAAEQKVDATPMEGFDNQAMDKVLELEKYNLKSTAIMAVGYRDAENDWLAPMKKVRTPKEDFIVEIA
ncbi:Nitroreductase [Sinomicrobium oceani]|uniref:Nitroreductase n=1 Tax=Sinomicrobium oceani TaxID=1150368 RepID=A0A1K1RQB9_9FLAO|nr:nitroreductase family protein [Sinomicrobium oceani]SFW74021.1 Nitroreductase [Sinomicrobium oceani]